VFPQTQSLSPEQVDALLKQMGSTARPLPPGQYALGDGFNPTPVAPAPGGGLAPTMGAAGLTPPPVPDGSLVGDVRMPDLGQAPANRPAAPAGPALAPPGPGAPPSVRPVRPVDVPRTPGFEPRFVGQGPNSLGPTWVTSPQEEALAYQQRATTQAYGNVAGFASPTGASPAQMAAIADLAGQGNQAAMAGSQQTFQGGQNDLTRQLQAALGAQDSQGRLDVAGVQGQTARDVAGIEAQSRNNPSTMKQQAVVAMLMKGLENPAGMDWGLVQGGLQQLDKVFPNAVPGQPTAGTSPAAAPGPPAGPGGILDANSRAAQFLTEAKPLYGAGGPDQIAAILDRAGSLPPEVRERVLAQIQSGALGDPGQFRRGLLQTTAGNYLLAQPPPKDPSGAFPAQYVVPDQFTLRATPRGGLAGPIAAGFQNVRTGGLPYNEVVDARTGEVVPFDPGQFHSVGGVISGSNTRNRNAAPARAGAGTALLQQLRQHR
jgi:hypothetical protein